jgi:hypothetical protein
VEEARQKMPEWHTILQDGEWQVLQNRHLPSWYKVLRNGDIFAEVQVKVDFPDENTLCEEIVIDRKKVLRRTNPAAPAALHPREILRVAQEVSRQ